MLPLILFLFGTATDMQSAQSQLQDNDYSPNHRNNHTLGRRGTGQCVWNCNNECCDNKCCGCCGCGTSNCGGFGCCYCTVQSCVVTWNSAHSPPCTPSEYVSQPATSSSFAICALKNVCSKNECQTGTSISGAVCAPFNPTSPVGFWKDGQYSSGTHTVTITHGVTHTSTVGSASTWGSSATQSVSKGFKFGGGFHFLGIGASASHTQTTTDTTETSQTISQQYSTTFSQSTTTSYSASVGAGQIWQWTWTFDGGACGTTTVQTEQIVQTASMADTPCCLSGYFADPTNPTGACIAVAPGQPVLSLCPTSSPTLSPTQVPTNLPTSGSPTTSNPTTISPTTPPSTNSPTAIPTSMSPTTSPSTNSPTATPTSVSPTTPPTTSTPTRIPTTLPTSLLSKPPSSLTSGSHSSQTGPSNNMVIIVGAVCGVLGLALIVVLVYFLVLRRSNTSQKYNTLRENSAYEPTVN